MCLCPLKASQARECLLTASPAEEDDDVGGSFGGLRVEGRKEDYIWGLWGWLQGLANGEQEETCSVSMAWAL